jgi:hypothetical protein
MGREPVHLGHQRSDVFAAWGDLEPEELLDREGVRLLVEEAAEVVHARDDRHGGAPGLVLALLLHPGVQISDDGKALHHRLAVQF